MLPEVGSTIVPPGLSRPSRSAASTMRQADAVLDRAAGVQVLELGEQPRAALGLERGEPDDGGVADQVEHRGKLTHGGNLDSAPAALLSLGMAESYGPATYGDLIADVYDDWYPERTDAAAEVAFLAQRAGRGPALELGIGTGRVALPLAQTGVDVHGIDASEAMVARLRAKPGGDRIPVTMGDFAEIPDGPACSLVYVVFNTFFGLLTQEAQVACFAGVARRARRRAGRS